MPPTAAASDEVAGARLPQVVRRLVAPRALLAWDVEGVPPRALACFLLAALRSLDAREAALDLRLGEGLGRLVSEFGVRVLGHARVADFAPARLGISGSHLKELRRVAAGLAELPLLRDAYLAGDLSRAKLRLVLRAVEPATQAGWLVLARRLSTRRLEAEVRAFRRSRNPKLAAAEEAAAKDDDPSQGVRVGWHCDEADAALFWGLGRAMVEQLVGHRVTLSEVAEVLSAEALTVLGDDATSAPTFPGLVRKPKLGAALPVPGTAWTSDELVALARHARRLIRHRPADVGLPDIGAPSEAWSLLEMLRDLMAERHGLEAERARLLALASGRSCHRELGFRTFDDFTQHALGMAPRDVAELIELDMRLMLLPELRRAWIMGCVSRLAVSLLSRVADGRTESEWLSWAGCVSFKRLEMETKWHLTQRAALSVEDYRRIANGGRPMRDTATRMLALAWRQKLRAMGEQAEARHASDAQADSGPEPQAAEGARPSCASGPSNQDPAWDSAERSALVTGRRVRVSFDCPPDVAILFEQALRAVSMRLGNAPDVATCVRWMLVHLVQTHASPEHEARWQAHAILERGAWRCAMPHCREMATLHVHHVWQRAHGGPLEPWNEMPLCERCHLLLVHGGLVKTEGRAPDDVVVSLGATMPGGCREFWRDERMIAAAPRLTQRWVPKARAA